MDSLGFVGLFARFGVFAKTDSRPCVVCPPSMAASYFLLLAQKKVTKENGTLGFAPSASLRVRYGRTGFAHRPSMACCRNRRDPSRRPRAVHAAGPSTLRRYSEGTRRAKQKRKKPTCRIYPVLLRQGLPRSALPGPSRPRRAGAGIAARSAGARRMRARSTRAQGRAPGEPRSLLA